MSWRKFLLIPELARSGMRASGDVRVAWDRYWGGIERTGSQGDVLWDADSAEELGFCRAQQERYLNPALPLVDLGCGNGRFTRALAPGAARAVGVDLSPVAVARAERESAGVPGVAFRALDLTANDAGAELGRELGDADVFVRGVLHVLAPGERRRFVDNARALLGRRGTLLFLETAFEGGILDYLEYLGARAGALPAQLRRCVETGIPKPSRFGARELERYFPATGWERVASGPADVRAVALGPHGAGAIIPGFFAALRPRPAS